MYNFFQVKRKVKHTTASQSNPTTKKWIKIKLHIQVEELTTNMVSLSISTATYYLQG